MTIRHGTDDDLDAVQRLWELWQSESPAPPPWADASWDANRAEVERALAANGLFLAEEDGEVVGFVSSWLEEHVARIGDLYVAESGRREGVGRALVEAVIENAASPRRARTSILNANLEALPFYDRLGFREESRNLVLPLEVRTVGGGRSFGVDPRPDRRHRRDRARGPPVRAAAARAARTAASSRRRATAGSPSTTTSATGTRRCCAAWRASSRSEPGAVVLALGVEHDAGRPLHPLRSAAGSSTSTSRFPSTTARSRPAT